MDKLMGWVWLMVLFALLGKVSLPLVMVYLISGRDLRDYGDGSPTITNLWRTTGPELGLLTLAGEIAKGYLLIRLAQVLAPNYSEIALVIAILAKAAPWASDTHQTSDMPIVIGGLYALNVPYIQLVTAIFVAVLILKRNLRSAQLACGLSIMIGSLINGSSSKLFVGLLLGSICILAKSDLWVDKTIGLLTKPTVRI